MIHLLLLLLPIWPQDGVTRINLAVADLQGNPIPGITVTHALAPTGDDGKTILAVNRQLRPGQELAIAIVGPSEWVFLTPRFHIQYPDTPGERVPVLVVRKGDRDILTSPRAKQDIVESLLVLIDARFDLTRRTDDEQPQKEALAEVAKNLNLPADTIDEALRLWQDQTQDPYQLGLSALYAKKFKEATHLLEETYVEAKQRVEMKRKDLAKNAFYLAQALAGEGRYREALPKYREAAALEPEDMAYARWLGSSLYDMGLYDEAEPLLRQALAIDEASYGPDHPRVATQLNNLAQLLSATNRMSEAEPLMKRALAIAEASYGLDHPEVAFALNNLAGLLQATNRMSEAEPLMERALAIDEASYGPDHPRVAIHLNNLAQLLQDTNRMSEAESLMKRALVIDEASYGPQHPNVAIRLNNLAQLLGSTNRMSEAKPLMRRALAIDEASYGPDHPRVATQLNNLAQLLGATNRRSEAEPLMKRALAIDEASYGPDHPNVAIRLSNLALLLKATNRMSETEPLMRRALAIDEASYGPDHPYVAIRLSNLASLVKAANRMTEAEPLMRRALTIDEATYGPDHPEVATDLNNLALLLQETNRMKEAEPLMRRALAIDKASYGPDHPKVARDLNNLASLLRATNRMSEAESLMRRALEIDQASNGPDHPRVAVQLNNLAQLLQATNRMSEAEPLMRRALAIGEASYGPAHPAVARDLNNLAQLLQDTNRMSEAEPLMRRALMIGQAAFGLKHPRTVRYAWNLLLLYVKTGESDKFTALLPKLQWLLNANDEDIVATDLQTHRKKIQQLIQAIQKADPQSSNNPLVTVARKYAADGDWSSATWHYEQAIKALPDQEPSADAAILHNRAGISCLKQGLGEKALGHFQQALAYYRDHKPEASMIGTLSNNTGSAYRVMGHWSEALTWLCRAVDWALEPNHDEGALPYTYGHLAQVHHALGDPATAAYHGEQSLIRCLQTENHDRALETAAILLAIYRDIGDQTRIEELQALRSRLP